MTRTDATKLLRDTLDANELRDWHIRLTTDFSKPFLGLCSYKDKCIILNAHHIDIHPTPEVRNTILHEVAHALTPHHKHDSVWADKARELGCDNTMPCANYTLSDDAVDAIRSGAELKVDFEEQIIRTPKYTVTRLQDKCEICGKVAKEKERVEVPGFVVITLECLHVILRRSDSKSRFEDLVFDGNKTCIHNWDKTICRNCNAKRLYKYQIEGARSLEKANGRLAIFDEMGLGKTIQALAYLKYNPECFPYLWVTKAGIKYQHAKEIIRVLGNEYFPQILQKGSDFLIPGMKGYLISYDLFRRLDLQMFVDAGIQSVVLDECQAIKNPDSNRTQAVRKVVREITKIIPLSGTPWKNRGSEFFVVLNMLDPKMFWSYKDFQYRYVSNYWNGNKYCEGGIKNPEKFREQIKHIAIRRERKEVMPELPLVNRTRLYCEVPDHARKVYNEERDKIKAIWNDAVLSGEEDSFKTNASIMQSLIIMRQIVGIAKVPTTVEYLQEFLEDTDRKIACFVHHKKCGELISEQMRNYCKENNLQEPLVLTADLSPDERFSVQEKFNSPNYRLLIASTLASGEGLNLQTCSDCILHERQWNPANEEQAEGRFIRIGQTAEQVNSIYVLGDSTVDTILDGIVEGKRIEFHNTMNKGSLTGWNEKSIIKELAAAIASQK